MIIGISGKINSGKDSVGIISQGLNMSLDRDVIHHHVKNNIYFNKNCGFEIKKFADKLKDILCILLGCTRGQFEDREFKEKELGPEWWYYKTPSKSLIMYLDNNQPDFIKKYELIKPTPRLLLQLLGTECGRNIIHPNVWVNALMNEYKPKLGSAYTPSSTDRVIGTVEYPNWIITDMRFSNELKAVEDRGGITIRVNRRKALSEKIKSEDGLESYQLVEFNFNKEHESETALDDAIFKYTIDNNGTIEELIQKVREILILEKII